METQIEFKVGDKVMLKTGGVVMSIEEFKDDMVVCVWNEKGRQKRDSFKIDVLKYPPKIEPTAYIMR